MECMKERKAASRECQTRSLHLHLEKSRRPSLPIASNDPFSAHCPMLFMTSHSAFSSATLPSHISTSYHPLLPTSYAHLLDSPRLHSHGVWVIAHECGHHAFSDYHHRRHHSNTGSLERDEVFVPKTKSRVAMVFQAPKQPTRPSLKSGCITSDWLWALISNLQRFRSTL
ncbi:hypothetical protein NC653_004878 [Populus alba x Populus x berolinensis]|uniref:Uncharacterized protein n=1 Tax=Populus alba x Populus x berolinensis TaxID=444605 RepID=A0AAD6WKN8_9ROSI|nr:hypothetical protein NC653_004878 [Populus alba x Populus x berolinensis]